MKAERNTTGNAEITVLDFPIISSFILYFYISITEELWRLFRFRLPERRLLDERKRCAGMIILPVSVLQIFLLLFFHDGSKTAGRRAGAPTR